MLALHYANIMLYYAKYMYLKNLNEFIAKD